MTTTNTDARDQPDDITYAGASPEPHADKIGGGVAEGMAGVDRENAAWEWLDRRFGTENDDPVDRAYDASEMVDAFHGGAEYQSKLFALSTTEANHVLVPEWQPMNTAPRNGGLVELVVDYSGDGDHPLQDATLACTIGFNSFDDDGKDEWKFAGWCWTHDHFVQGKGTPVAWRPSRLNAADDGLPPLPLAVAPTAAQEAE